MAKCIIAGSRCTVGLSNETFQKECVLDLILFMNVPSKKQSLRF